jgi:hypothetical protein
VRSGESDEGSLTLHRAGVQRGPVRTAGQASPPDTAHDALTLATVPPLLAIIMILASWIPARRAMRMDPLVAIREE